jgi:hypothetical protein
MFKPQGQGIRNEGNECLLHGCKFGLEKDI